MLPAIACAVLVVLNPAGPVHTVFTATGASTDELNSTVQVRVTSDPIGQVGLTGSLVIVTEFEAGTKDYNN